MPWVKVREGVWKFEGKIPTIGEVLDMTDEEKEKALGLPE